MQGDDGIGKVSTLKKISSVVPGEVSCEVFPVGIDSFLSIEFLGVSVKDDLVFSGDFDADAVVCVTI